MRHFFHRIKPDSVQKGIVQQIKDLIRDGKLHPGEKLPSERTLSEIFGVGRSSLREAMNTLETLGFVEKRDRAGIFVRSIGSPIVSDPLMQMLEEDETKFYDLYEIRKDIEIASADMAARNRTQNDLNRIETILLKMEKNVQKRVRGHVDDLEFHIAIAEGSHNLLRVHILKNIFDLFGDFITYVATKIDQDPKNSAINIRQHNQIYQAINLKDSKSARNKMNEHMSWIEEKWIEFGPKKG